MQSLRPVRRVAELGSFGNERKSMSTKDQHQQTSIGVNFEYRGPKDPEMPYAMLPAMPRVGDKIRKDAKGAIAYIVAEVIFEVPERDDDRATVLCVLEAAP